MMIEDMLDLHGCRIVGRAVSVAGALDLVDQVRPDAVTLDGNLRGDLSSPVAKRLDELGIPYLLVTGYVESTLADPVLSTAPRLSKPFTGNDLAAAVATHLCSKAG
jgi:DNA-binding NarL/FixJ family response regulator